MEGHLVVLVGHGGVPTDAPRDLVVRLKQLEAARRRQGTNPTEEEVRIEQMLRTWPRTPENDPYKHGLESIAAELAPLILPRRLRVAYNEFCAPSVAEALDTATAEGFRRVTLLTTMVTPGGSHADREIPEIVAAARARYPSLLVDYAWPYEPTGVATFLAGHLERHLGVA